MKKPVFLVAVLIFALSPVLAFAVSASVEGTLTYSGVQTGSVYVGAFRSLCSPGAVAEQSDGPLTVVGSSVAYSIESLAFDNTQYWICAYLDANSNGPNGPDGGDPVGAYPGNPLTINNPGTLLDIDFSLSDTPLNSTLVGTAPTIDGNFYSCPNEWPADTSGNALEITGPIHTRVYIKNNTSSLFMMVDAASVSGDYSEDAADHCSVYVYYNGKGLRVTVFGDGTKVCESTNSAGPSLTWNPIACPVGVKAMDGFGASTDKPTPHRMYEFAIPLSTIGASSGDIVYFASPDDAVNSLPFDDNVGNYNLWPANSFATDLDTWGQIQLGQSTLGVPAITEWGLLLFAVLAGFAAFYVIKKQKQAKG